MRIKYIDILKGLLIICVVLGHAPFGEGILLHKYIYWFHMPVFFMISGYLTRWDKYSLREVVRSRYHAYVIPYFAFSIFFIMFSKVPLKDIVRTILGGSLNITNYSYPFWFINTLFVSICLLKWMQIKLTAKQQIAVACIMWVMIHLLADYNCVVSLPWGVEYCLLAIPYLMIGKWCREKEFLNKKEIHAMSCLSAVILVLFVCGEYVLGNTYIYNMQKLVLNDFLLDLFIPILCLLIFCRLSQFLSCIPIVSDTLAYIGKSCMVIFFLHAGVICHTRGILVVMDKTLNSFLFFTNIMAPTICAVIAIVVGTVLFYVLGLFKITKFCFLGK